MEYSNKLASKIYGAIGSFLLVLNTLGALFWRRGTSSLLGLTLLLVVMARVIIENIIIKKFKLK